MRHVSDKSINSREESIGKNNFDFDLFDGQRVQNGNPELVLLTSYHLC